jgi:branched-chain amino acid transport system substrate-binding protein
MRARARLLGAAAFVVAVIGIASGCGGGGGGSKDATKTETGTSNTKGTTVVGAAIAFSGDLQPYDVPPFNGALMKIKEINESGGLLGQRIKVVRADTRSDLVQGSKAGLKVIEDGAKMVIATCDFDYGAPAATVAQNHHVLAISLCASSSKFGPGGIGDLAFSMGTSSEDEGAVLAEFAAKKKMKRVYLLINKSISFETEVTNAFATRLKELGGSIVGKDYFQDGDQTIASQITRLKSVNPAPDAIFVASIHPALDRALRQIRAAGIKTTIIGDDNYDGTYWLKAVPNLSNVYYAMFGSMYGDDADAQMNDFFKKYSETYGGLPDNAYAVAGYSLIEAYAKAVERAGSTDPDAVKTELEKFANEKLLIGSTTFNQEMHISTSRPMRIMKIANGKDSFVAIVTPKKVPPPTK